MPYTTIDEYGTSNGMSDFFSYVQSVVPFYDLLLFVVILLIFTLGTYFIQETKKGKGDFVVAFVVGCTVTSVLAGIMGMIPNFVQFKTLGILIGLTIISYFWLWFDSKS